MVFLIFLWEYSDWRRMSILTRVRQLNNAWLLLLHPLLRNLFIDWSVNMVTYYNSVILPLWNHVTFFRTMSVYLFYILCKFCVLRHDANYILIFSQYDPIKTWANAKFKLRGAYDKFPDFFRMGTFIHSTHMKL